MGIKKRMCQKKKRPIRFKENNKGNTNLLKDISKKYSFRRPLFKRITKKKILTVQNGKYGLPVRVSCILVPNCFSEKPVNFFDTVKKDRMFQRLLFSYEKF